MRSFTSWSTGIRTDARLLENRAGRSPPLTWLPRPRQNAADEDPLRAARDPSPGVFARLREDARSSRTHDGDLRLGSAREAPAPGVGEARGRPARRLQSHRR